jgi:plasmid stabilization system protein ParE
VAHLIWTPEARWWLREIHQYISRDSPTAAYKVVHGIYEKAHLPLTFPDIGHLHQPDTYPGVRILLYGRYRIAYQRRTHTRGRGSASPAPSWLRRKPPRAR